jgi:hypothetical protein
MLIVVVVFQLGMGLVLKTNDNGKKISYSESAKRSKILNPSSPAMFPLRQKTRLYAGFRIVQDLFP